MKPSSSPIRCPTCGARAMRRVQRDVETRVGKRTVVVKDVEVEECERCNERLYDLQALHRIADAKRGSWRRRAA